MNLFLEKICTLAFVKPNPMKQKQVFPKAIFLACLLGILFNHASAQKRYKHLRHARTPEGKVILSSHSAKDRGTSPVLEQPPVTQVTSESFAGAEVITEPQNEFPALTASVSDMPAPVIHETRTTVKLRKAARSVVKHSDEVLNSLPFASQVIQKTGLEALEPNHQQVDGKKFIIIGIILLGAALIFGIVGLALSIALAITGQFPWTLIFNVIGLMLFFAGAALLTVGIIFRIKEKRAAN